jgi:hypothetical protein
VSITILRWTGQHWSRVGHVNGLTDNDNFVGLGLWYSAVDVPGSPFPGFAVKGWALDLNRNVVVGFLDGSWRAVPQDHVSSTAQP